MSNTVSTVFVARQNPNLFALKYTNKSVSFTPSGDAHRLGTAVNISNVATTNPVLVTTSLAHGYSNGNEVFISGVIGTTEVNNRSFTITGATTFTFQLLGVDGLLYTAYISGGIVRKLLMSQIVPSPNARQTRQALEQGLRGIAKTVAMTATVLVTSFPLLSKFATFACSKTLVIVGILANKTPSMSRTFVVQTTNDVSKAASFVTSGTTTIVPSAGSYDLTLEVNLGGGSTPGFDALAEVFQI